MAFHHNMYLDLKLPDIFTNKRAEKYMCETCKKILEIPQRCRKCKDVYYCSIECQKKDWKTHKEICVAPDD